MHICGKRYIHRVEDITKVTVYSNLPEVELFVNGTSLGKQKSKDHFFYFQVPNQGISTLVAIAENCKDNSLIKKVDTFDESYRLKEKNAILNWFDITAPDGYFSLNDKISEILKNPKGKELFLSFASSLNGVMGTDTNFTQQESMMKMLESFTVLRMVGLLGAANVTVTKEQLLNLNAQLNQIKK